jgi:hypothetical protein
MLKDYQKTLQDLDKAHTLEPNNVFFVTMHGNVKRTLKDCEITSKDLEKVKFLMKQCNYFKHLWTNQKDVE